MTGPYAHIIGLAILLIVVIFAAWTLGVFDIIDDFFSDLMDWLTDAWYNPFAVLLAIILIVGVIFWIWWATLIIVAAAGIVTILIVVISENYGSYHHTDHDEGDYESMTVAELKGECRDRGLKGYSQLRKYQLIDLLKENDEYDEDNEEDNDDEVLNTSAKADKQKRTTVNKGHIPTIKLTDIAGLDDAKLALEERVILPLKHKDVYAKYNKQTGGGILLYGLPGTGKTMFAQAVATELDAKFFSIKCSDIESKWIGEGEKRVKDLFTRAKKCERAVIFFDEFDSLGRRRSEENDNGSNVLQEILTQMQGVEVSPNTLLVVAATNCPWQLDGALLRPGRFNEKIHIPLPDKAARRFILERGLRKCPLADDVDLDYVAERLDGCNGADVAEFCEKVKMILIRKEISKTPDLTLTASDIETVLTKTKTSVLQRDMDKMNEFIEDL